jgi:hypothetical protein
MRLRAKGQSWRVIARQVGVSVRPLRQAYQSRGKRVAKPIPGPKPHQFYQITDSQGRPRPGVTVTFWTSSGTGILCTPLVRIFTDASLTIPAANPMTTDGLGNLPVIYAASGVYKYTVSGTSVTSSGPLTATVAARNVLLAGNNSFTRKQFLQPANHKHSVHRNRRPSAFRAQLSYQTSTRHFTPASRRQHRRSLE